MEEIKKNELICKPLIALNLFYQIYTSNELCATVYVNGLLQVYSFVKGDVKLEFSLFNFNIKNKIFLYKQNIFSLEGNIFKNVRFDKVISTFPFENDLKTYQYDKFLVIVTTNFIYKYDLETIDENKGVNYSVTSLKNLQYTLNDSLFVKNNYGSVLMYYDKSINYTLKNLVLKNTIEFVSQKNNNSGFIKFIGQPLKFFIIRNTVLSTVTLEEEKIFNYSSPTEKYIITPGEQSISFYDKSTLKKVKTFHCLMAKKDSLIQCLATGDILITVGSRVYLVIKI